jgi:hypothetical protein
MTRGEIVYFSDFIKMVLKLADLERREVVYGKKIKRDDINPFLTYFADHFIYNINNQAYIELEPLKNNIEYLQKILFINIKDFCDLLNTEFNYSGNDQFTRYYRIILRTFNIDIDNINDSVINNIKNNRDAIIQYTNFSTYLIDNLILRYYVCIAHNIPFTEFKNNRKISFLDFNEECCGYLKLDTLIDIYVKNLCFDDSDIIANEILLKAQRLNKLYSIDIPLMTSEVEFRQYTAAHKDRIDELTKIDTVEVIQKLIDIINTQKFKHKATVIINEIIQDMNLITCIIKINIDFLEGTLDEMILHRYIEVMINHIDYDVPSEITKLNERQKCLLKQVCSGVMPRLIEDFNSKPNYSLEFKNIFKEIIDNIPDKCSRYINEHMEIKCYHSTFHFYSLNKWMNSFCTIFSQLTNKNCEYTNIMHTSIDLLYPKKSFCDSCHEDYKYLQNEQIHFNQRSPLYTKFEAFRLGEKLLFFRKRFADQCDTTLYSDHFLQIGNQTNRIKSILSEIILSMRSEITRFGYMLR